MSKSTKTLPYSIASNGETIIIRIGPEDAVQVSTHYGDAGRRTCKEIIIFKGQDKQTTDGVIQS